MESVAPASMITFLAPNPDQPASQRLVVNRGRASNGVIAASFSDQDAEDACVFAPDGAETILGDCTMHGELFWMRSQDRALRQIVAINAKALSVGGETIFESQESIPYVNVHLWENGMVIERGEHEGKVYVRDIGYRQFQRS
jgi:hypothetical protein